MSRLQWTKQYVDNHVSSILKQQKDEKQVSHDVRQIVSDRGMLQIRINYGKTTQSVHCSITGHVCACVTGLQYVQCTDSVPVIMPKRAVALLLT